MNEKDLKTRKQWLFALFAYGAFAIMSTFQTMLNGPQELPYPLVLFPLATSIFTVILFCYALYRCAYKKPGTKFLTALLIIVPISTIGSFIIAAVNGYPVNVDIWFVAGYVAMFVLYIMNFKLLRLNKHLNVKS